MKIFMKKIISYEESMTNEKCFHGIPILRQSLTKLLNPPSKKHIFVPLPPRSMLIDTMSAALVAGTHKSCLGSRTNIDKGGGGQLCSKNHKNRVGPTIL